MKKEYTTNDIMEVLISFRDHVGEQFQELREDMEREFKAVRDEMDLGLKAVRGEMESSLAGLRTQMVTKDYLDIKLSDLKGELIAIIRGEDNKLTSLIEILFKKGTLSREETYRLLRQEPFGRSI